MLSQPDWRCIRYIAAHERTEREVARALNCHSHITKASDDGGDLCLASLLSLEDGPDAWGRLHHHSERVTGGALRDEG